MYAPLRVRISLKVNTVVLLIDYVINFSLKNGEFELGSTFTLVMQKQQLTTKKLTSCKSNIYSFWN